MDLGIILLLVVAIVAVTLLLARRAIREDEGKGRGTTPGKGHITLHSHYSSGLGGQSRSYQVPREPQDYAKTFIPKDKTR
ncbi:MAG: hypothetical protein EP318_00430 [Rhodobacteraceae bacterium]|nr:MAG: hypothetical protein EP318_00430 [Paracoccaceae bacterium]